MVLTGTKRSCHSKHILPIILYRTVRIMAENILQSTTLMMMGLLDHSSLI